MYLNYLTWLDYGLQLKVGALFTAFKNVHQF